MGRFLCVAFMVFTGMASGMAQPILELPSTPDKPLQFSVGKDDAE